MGRQRNYAPASTTGSTYLEEQNVKVTLVTCAAGPQGVAKPGTVLDVPADKAKELLDSRYAREYDGERDKKAPQGMQRAPDFGER